MNIEQILNQFPEVTWDRFIYDANEYIIYGWIDREQDAYKDFMVVTVTEQGYFFVTSSAKHSAEFARRINPGIEAIHANCQRVEEHFPGVKSVKL